MAALCLSQWRVIKVSLARLGCTLGKLPLTPEEWPYPNRVLSRQTLAQWVRQHLLPDAKLAPIVEDDAPARRRDLSRLLYGLWRAQGDDR
jgi:hypothetical protein